MGTIIAAYQWLKPYLSEMDHIFSIIQSLVVIIGIIIGGWWTWFLFIKNRQKYPRANMTHEISHIRLSEEKILLRVAVNISNIGSVIISLIKCDIRVSQILPSNKETQSSIDNYNQECKTNENKGLDSEIEWPLLKLYEKACKKEECEIEPGESEKMYFDFIIDSNIEIVSIYSHFTNATKENKTNLGWSVTTVYNLKEAVK